MRLAVLRLVVLWLIAACGACGSKGAGGDGGATVDGRVDVADVHFIGRFDGQHRFAWPGSAVRARFDGSDLSVTLEDGGQDWFELVIDGVAQPPLQALAGENSYVLASGLPAGEHDVELVRRTESFFGVSRFVGFSGAPLVPSAGPGRTIELVGDSITCGYGVLGAAATCPFSADTEAETYAWGALAAADLDAAAVAIAYSGKGMYRSYGGDLTDPMPVLYQRTFADDDTSVWDSAGYVPDVIVVNLGTNDFSTGDPGSAYVDAYLAFVRELRARHPAAWILVASSPMLSDGYPAGAMQRTLARQHLDAVVSGAADGRVVFVDIAEQLAADDYGCDYHPSRITQEKMAQALASRVRQLTGW